MSDFNTSKLVYSDRPGVVNTVGLSSTGCLHIYTGYWKDLDIPYCKTTDLFEKIRNILIEK